MLRTYRTCNSTVGFLKYKFYNKLLGGVILLRVTLGVTLSNVTPLNNLLQNSYFENPTVELHVLYVLTTHANFHVKWMLFIIQSINLFLCIILNYKNLI